MAQKRQKSLQNGSLGYFWGYFVQVFPSFPQDQNPFSGHLGEARNRYSPRSANSQVVVCYKAMTCVYALPVLCLSPPPSPLPSFCTGKPLPTVHLNPPPPPNPSPGTPNNGNSHPLRKLPDKNYLLVLPDSWGK